MKVLHIIIGLDIGGAELMLKRLVESHQGNPDYGHSVISLTGIGKVGLDLRASGIEVMSLSMRSALDAPRILWRLVKLIRSIRPDIVQTWMYHADLLGGLAARLAGTRQIIWGVRCSGLTPAGKPMTQRIVSLCSWTSYFLPKAIVCCAETARLVHKNQGYDDSKMLVIPNGYDLSRFSVNSTMRDESRRDFGFNDDEVVVGIVGRFDPLKDYRNFLRAAAIVATKIEKVKFLMVGRRINLENSELKKWLDEDGFASRFLLLGERSDVPECMAAMDMLCMSSSKEEGFPNVVCEAMAMSVPCVATDSGDASEIIADTGRIVPPGDSNALADALISMITRGTSERTRLGLLARRRIEQNYSIAVARTRFEDVYKRVLGLQNVGHSD
jgi:glycosyltransferase involved in cell wall biosynthesis